jgi:ABC-type glutathione transport system ATPase component
VEVVQSGLQTAYAGAIASALKGSGLHYGRLAPLLAQACTPRELGEAVEQGRASDIHELANLDPERAARLVNHLGEYGIAELLTAPVEDRVIFRLLDGPDYKPTPELSTGQRCTVVLTIVLQHDDRTLILDQPEDHLDNAYVTETLIPAISKRGAGGQLIIATHNANIPVLGEADRVIGLESDGRRGYVTVCGELEAPKVVEEITRVMEGGREAFRRRARFYAVGAD